MHSNNIIQEELKELNSMLAGISNRNVYTVPNGYFDVLSHDILLAVQQKNTISSDNSSVPAGYFEGLADAIMGKIKASDDESALLTGIKNINVYRVPLGYFEGLEADILTKLPQPAKVFVMKKRSSFFNYAAAAVITGIIGLSVISVFNKKESVYSTQENSEMASIDPKNIDEAFSTLTDADIVNYLQKDGQDVNAALVASITDDKNLPDQVDYLTDDKTLENLLNELKPGESTNN